MARLSVGVALSGSFCTFERVMKQIRELVEQGMEVTPILSFNASGMDTRFGKAEDWKARLREMTGKEPLTTLAEVEPIGPKGMLDVLVVAPCTGTTLARLANGLSDTPVSLAVKSHLRRSRPVVLAVSTNDGLGGAAKNIGQLLNYKIYFVPMNQDDIVKKPRSLVAEFDKTLETLRAALDGRQLMPLFEETKAVR